MNYTCGVYIVVLHAALERFEATRKISRNPNPFKQQLDHLNRLTPEPITAGCTDDRWRWF
ncbi:hypothetical protein CsSME_00009400 [Camellia sinensis var. sinensis]